MTPKSSSDKKHSCTPNNENHSSEYHSNFPVETKATHDPTFTAHSAINEELRATRQRSSRMHVPAHVVVLFVAIIIFESSVLFVYTIIGLVKSNPTPYFTPTYGNPPAVQCIQYEPHAAPQVTMTSMGAIPYLSERFGVRQSQSVGDAGVSNVQTIEATSEALLEAATTTIMPRSVTTLLPKPAFVTSVVLLTTVLDASTTLPRSTIFVTTVVPLATDSG